MLNMLIPFIIFLLHLFFSDPPNHKPRKDRLTITQHHASSILKPPPPPPPQRPHSKTKVQSDLPHIVGLTRFNFRCSDLFSGEHVAPIAIAYNYKVASREDG